MKTIREELPSSDADYDAAVRRILDAARNLPPTPRTRRGEAAVKAGVDRLTVDHIHEAVTLWQETREVPRHIRSHPESYKARMRDTLNQPSAYPIRRLWLRAVPHVLLMTDRWPTEKDLMEAARDLSKGDPF